MKHNYNIKVDPPMPSEEQIAKHKDFDAVLKRYEQVVPQLHRKLLYKNTKAFLGLTLAGVIGFLVFQAVREEEKGLVPEKPAIDMPAPPSTEFLEAKDRAFLKAPVAAAAPSAHRLSLASDQPALMRLADGSTIEVPKDAFETLEGRPISGDVEVAVRVLRDPLDHVLAGIPLQDHAEKAFRSHGTVEVSASQGGQPLRLRPGSKVRMQLQVPQGTSSSQLMHLDTENYLWTAVPGTALKTVAQPAAPSLNDGFGIVEFGPDGKPVRKQAVEQGNDATRRFVQVLEVATLGHFSLSSGPATATDQQALVEIADAQGQRVKVYSLHRIPRGSAADVDVVSFFPHTSAFDYQLHWSSAQEAVFFGFLPDGRVLHGSTQELNALQPKAPWVMKASPSPIKNKSDLMQLLAI